MSCAVLSVEFVFVVLAVVTEPAVLVGSAVTVVLAAGAGVTVVVTGSTGEIFFVIKNSDNNSNCIIKR